MKAVVNVGPQRVQGNAAIGVALGSGHFGPAEAT
jgi:hypothetical protein